MKVIFTILFFIFNFGLYAQSFHNTKADFKKISVAYKPPVHFYFKNETNEPLAILQIHCDNELIVFYKKSFIYPTQTSIISVHYDGNKLGKFKYKIKIITNISSEPIILKVKGKMIKVQDCSCKKKTLRFWLKYTKVDERKEDEEVSLKTIDSNQTQNNRGENCNIDFTYP